MTESVEQATQPPSGSLRSRVAFGVRWGAIDQVGQLVLRIGGTIALARLLTPGVIGTMALATVVLSLGSVVVGLGVSDALIQRRLLDERYVSVAFSICSLSGLGVTALTVVLAGPLATVFHDNQLKGVLVALSVVFLLSGIERTPNDMLVRQMRFRDYYISSTLGVFISVSVGVAAAVAGAGVWSLVAMAISESAVATGLAWTFALRSGVWRPTWGWDTERARVLLGFGGFVAGSRVIGFARGNVDNLAVGKVLGTVSLGYYAIAHRAIVAPIAKVAAILGMTAFSVFSSLQDDIPKVRLGLARANAYVAAICFPATIGVGVTAPLLIPVVFGQQWAPAVRTAEILALLGPYYAFITLDGPVFHALGKPRFQFVVMVLDLVILIPAVVIGVGHGLTGVAVAVVIAPYATLSLRLAMRMRLLESSLLDQVRPVVPVVLATAAMVAVTLPARKWLQGELPDVQALILAILVGAASYTLALRIIAPGLLAHAWRDLRGHSAPA